MNSSAGAKLIPVLRRPRREWQIPLVESHAREVERQKEEARRKALFQGTTSYGREIFRRMLHRAWNLCEENRKGAISELEVELSGFPELRQEFSLLLHRLGGGTAAEEAGELSPAVLAALLVARARLGQRLNREHTAPAEIESG